MQLGEVIAIKREGSRLHKRRAVILAIKDDLYTVETFNGKQLQLFREEMEPSNDPRD